MTNATPSTPAANTMPMPQPIKVYRDDENAVACDFLIPADLVYFPGHFPRQPVLPGVAMIDWVMILAREYLDINPDNFVGMETIKFKQLVTPGKVVTVSLKYMPTKQKLQFVVNSPDGEYSSGKINLAAAPASAGREPNA